MLRRVREILIRAQKNEVMSDAELRNQSINGSDLYTRPATRVSHGCRSHMVFAVRLDQCQRREPLDNLLARLGTSETLKKFLQYKTGRDDNFFTGKRVFECPHFGHFNFNIASEGKRPDARVNQKRHFRERSDL